MAVLMRRLLVDAHGKLRRMVEEHTVNLATRIDSEYPSSTPTPSRESLGSKHSDAATNILDFSEHAPSEENEKTEADARDSAVTEARRSQSLNSAITLETADESKSKKEVIKKCKSAPSKSESLEASADEKPSMAVEDAPIRESRAESPKPGCSTEQDFAVESTPPRSPRSSDGTKEEPYTPITASSTSALKKMKQENDRLQAENTRLRRLVVSGASTALAERTKISEEDINNPTKLQALELELQLAKEAISALKSDRKRLKAEKFDLLHQMKQLYATLEDKEKELRDFIRNYEQRVRENETSLQQLSNEREERERERWSLLRHARDEAERSLSLAAQLNAKELQLQQAQEHLQEARRQLTSGTCISDQESLISISRHTGNGGALTPGSGGILSGHHGLGLLAGDRGSCSADSGVRVSSDRESGTTSIGGNLSDSTTDGTPTITVEGSNEIDSVSVVSSIPPPHMYQLSTPKDCSPTLSPLNANSFSRSIDSGALSRSVEQLSSPVETEPPAIGRRSKHLQSRPSGRGGTWGSISRVFARSRHRNKASSLQESDNNYDPYRSWSPLTEEGYAEKLRLLREASSIPMERWRAPTVLAWLEVALGMPQYGARCAENIKSGKIGDLHGQVLLELNDIELECGLGITHPMHRKKLRLAIEEHRHPALVRYPCIAQLGHTWVSSEWLPDLGLSQYSESFATNLVDARMLEHLSKKELEKFLGVTRKFHQASVVHGIHLLRIMKYDRQVLAVRRHQCENVDADPLVWTNQRFIRWARNIDLGEYADNLKDSGVHGGLVVLEPSFNGDTMATALGIPASKNIIRRHLTAELEALVLPARSTLEHYVRVKTKSRIPGGSLGRSFSRSCAGLITSSADQSMEARRQSLRGSISRAFGLVRSKTERDQEKLSPTSSSGSSSVISQISPPPIPCRSSHSGGESPDYAVPFHYPHANSYQSKLHNIHEFKAQPTVYISPSSKDKKANFLGGSLHRNKHRRVRSISDIDTAHVEPL
ncbi:kazrin isoform X2 [Photinus pyralis]|nr:kazrin isoform X2 [Photinus pyralis]